MVLVCGSDENDFSRVVVFVVVTAVCTAFFIITDSRVAIGIQRETNENTYDDRMGRGEKKTE